MLAKMGYREGQGIGIAGQGRIDPVGVDLKASRSGLGIDEKRKRQREHAQAQQGEKGAVPCYLETSRKVFAVLAADIVSWQ